MLSTSLPTSEVFIDYTNWKGERSWRRIVPICIWFGSTDFHPDKTWLLDAKDLDKQAIRSFAMKDIHEWRDAAPEMALAEKKPAPRVLKGRVVSRYVRPTYRLEE